MENKRSCHVPPFKKKSFFQKMGFCLTVHVYRITGTFVSHLIFSCLFSKILTLYFYFFGKNINIFISIYNYFLLKTTKNGERR